MKKLIFLTLTALILLPVSALASLPSESVPEPTSLILIITGLVGMLSLRRIFKE